MQKSALIIGSILVVLSCPMALQARDAAKVGPWEKMNEKDGIIAYARTNSLVPFKEALVVGVVGGAVAMIENMMRNWNAYEKVLFQISYQNMIIPGGAIEKIPASFVDLVLKYVGIITIQNIRELAKEETYQHAKAIITQTPWPAELRFYAEDVPTK